jgi:hypothetical protein
MQSELEAGSMQIGEARQTLLEIDRVRRDTRRDLHPTWFVNVVIGVFFAGATLLALAAPDDATLNNVYWAIGIPLGFALAAITTAVIAVAPADAWAWVQLPMAGLLIAAGLAARGWEHA